MLEVFLVFNFETFDVFYTKKSFNVFSCGYIRLEFLII